eukprot:6487169-Amphidinium_carterae.1
MQSQQLKRVRNLEKTTRNIRPNLRSKGTTITATVKELTRITKPTWNNATQSPSEFIRHFSNWRDDIYNYENTVSEIAATIKLATLLQHIQGEVRAHLLLNFDLANPDFDAAITKVEEYYRNVYIDNNYSTRDETEEEKEKATTQINNQKEEKDIPTINKATHPTPRAEEKEESTAHDLTTSNEKEKEVTRVITTTTTQEKGNTTHPTSTRAKEKRKTQRIKGQTFIRHTSRNRKGKGSTKGKGKGNYNSYYNNYSNITCYLCGKPGHTADKCWWKGTIHNIDQTNQQPPVWSLPNDGASQMQMLQQQPPQSSALTTIMTQPQQMSQYETGSFNTAINSIYASTLTISKDYAKTNQVRQWAILIDTGAITSVASREHFPHIPIRALRPQNAHNLTAINGEQINIYGIKQNIAIPTTFIISDVNCAILGLATITNNNLLLRVQGQRGHLSKDQHEVQLHYIGNHFYLKATVFDGLYDYVDYTKDFESWYYDWYGGCDDMNNKVYGLQDDAPDMTIYADYIVGDTSRQEANQPKTYKEPSLPTRQEIDEHNLTHLPYRDWCKHCVQGKSKSHQHQKED